MICHVVLIRLRSDVDEGRRAWFLVQAREVLGPIPGVQNLRVGTNIKPAGALPYCLVMEFESEKELQAYQVHAQHQHFLKDIIGPLVEEKQVYDYRY